MSNRMMTTAEAEALITGLPRPLVDQPAAEYEFSVRLIPGGVERRGRFGVWLSGTSSAAFQPIREWLTQMGAPPEAMEAQAATGLPARQGVAVATGDTGTEFKLYLQSTDPERQTTVYTAVRWNEAGKVQTSCYTFHFSPETPRGERPADVAPAWAREMVEALADDETMQRSSGFWLRHDDGQLKQLDLAFPWQPRGETLPALMAFAEHFQLPETDRTFIAELPIRHIAISTVERRAEALTLYLSSPLESTPSTEDQLQQGVRERALGIGIQVQNLTAAWHASSPPSRNATLDHFYSGDLDMWSELLGPGMHYHHGIFNAPYSEPDDEAMLLASRRAVTELYPFIEPGDRVYDIGCGWGGPLAMLNRERKCRGLGLTVARNQFRHVAAQGLPVRWGDAEATTPPGLFDCALLIESFEHIRDKLRLLRMLLSFSRRLVMRVSCQDYAPPSVRFGGTMHMISSEMLKDLLAEAGWRLIHWRDRRKETMPMWAGWRRRLVQMAPTSDLHVEAFREMANRLEFTGDQWADNNPLIEVVAEP